MSRNWVPALAALGVTLLTVAALAVGVEAWAGLYPHSTLLGRATTWPAVGGWITAVRERHLGPPATRQPIQPRTGAESSGRGPAPPGVAEPTTADPPKGVWPEVWLAVGGALRSRPSADAPVVVHATAIANVAVLEAREGWRRVRWHGHQGWVRARPDVGPPLGSAAEPVRPVGGRPPIPEYLAAATAVLGLNRVASAPARQVGPYPLLTDVEEPALLLLLDRSAAAVEDAYRLRYGLAVTGAPAEVVVLFRSRAAYDDYLARTGGPHAEFGHVAGGVVALSRAGRLQEDVRATLLHELVHLLGRRALGPALPPWLDEGMADDIAESRIGEGGRPLPGTLDETTLRSGEFLEFHGGGASRRLLRRKLTAGGLIPLAELTALDPDQFHAVEPPVLAYAESSFFVRFLLAGDLADRFRAFLGGVAGGLSPTPDTLQTALGRPWPALDGAFAKWIDSDGVSGEATPGREVAGNPPGATR